MFLGNDFFFSKNVFWKTCSGKIVVANCCFECFYGIRTASIKRGIRKLGKRWWEDGIVFYFTPILFLTEYDPGAPHPSPVSDIF